MYITVEAAEASLVATGDALREPWASATNDQKGFAVARATRRLELIPFRTDSVFTPRPRYTDGVVTGGDYPIESHVASLVALLAFWYHENPLADVVSAPEGDSLAEALSDLPLSIQSGIWPLTTKELLGGVSPEYFLPEEPVRNTAFPLVFGTGASGAGGSAPAPAQVPVGGDSSPVYLFWSPDKAVGAIPGTAVSGWPTVVTPQSDVNAYLYCVQQEGVDELTSIEIGGLNQINSFAKLGVFTDGGVNYEGFRSVVLLRSSLIAGTRLRFRREPI